MTKSHRPNSVAPMTRQQFLKLAAAAGGALAADGLLGPVGKAFAQGGPVYDPAISAKPIQTKPIPSSGEALPIIGMGTAVVYEIETSDPKFPALVESVKAFLNGGSIGIFPQTYPVKCGGLYSGQVNSVIKAMLESLMRGTQSVEAATTAADAEIQACLDKN